MDISIINTSEVTGEIGIFVGKTSEKQMLEFINVRCPYCKKWFEDSIDLLEEAVAQGKVQRVIKLFDKEKESLQRGNVMHRYVTKTDGGQAIQDLAKIYETQQQWGSLSLEEVALFAEKTLGLTEQVDAVSTEKIITEASAANIKFVPTIILGEAIFDENISSETLTSYFV